MSARRSVDVLVPVSSVPVAVCLVSFLGGAVADHVKQIVPTLSSVLLCAVRPLPVFLI